MLYELLAGAPPFRRETAAETMWAHLQTEPPPLENRPALDSVIRKALAKEREARYPTCRELIGAARAAIEPAAATARHPHPLIRHRRSVLAAGLLVTAVVAIAALLALSSGGDGRAAPAGTGVAVIGPTANSASSLIERAIAPSNLAIGDGAVWVLNSEDGTVSRIDPATKAITQRIRTTGVVTDIAAGDGALWLGRGHRPNGGGGYITGAVSRVDPRTGPVTRTVQLPDRGVDADSVFFNWGYPNIIVGTGAVWAVDPDQTISRLDARTGRLVKTIAVHARGIAAGPEGVWFRNGNTVTRVDPRTNRVGQTISLGSPAPDAIAVGAGKVWVSAPPEGVVWRVDPGPSPVTSTIRVGEGVTYVAYGAGSVWAANYVDSTVSRLDPRTGEVKATIPVGGAQALAAGAGAAWVSSAGGFESGTLPASACGELVSGGGTPDVQVVSDLPLQGPDSAGPRAMTDAITQVLRQHDFRAGRFTVGYRSCDDSTRQTGNFENRRCAANANAIARADKAVALIGPYNSDCAAIEIPVLNRAPGGPVPIIGPTTTYQGLTRGPGIPPPGGYRHEPQVYYPTGVRNLVRLPPGDDQLAGAQAMLAKQLRLHRLYVLDDGEDITRKELSDPFRRAARRLGVEIVGVARFDRASRTFGSIADAAARSRPDGIVLGADPLHGGDKVLRALRARLGPRIPILAHFFFFDVTDVLRRAGAAGHNVYVATNDLPRAAMPQTPAARRFESNLGEPATQLLGVLEVGQAAELVVQAIARSDGSRASVLHALRTGNVKNGLLGTFGFDHNGDNTAPLVPIVRIVGRSPRADELPGRFRGSVRERVEKVPAALVQ
jgi:branched-chain amino acid transport system substrate-binding protein